jgi:hypothetical protein
VSTGSGTELKTVDKSALRVLLVGDNAADVDLVLNELRKSFDLTSDAVERVTFFNRRSSLVPPWLGEEMVHL